MQLKRILDGGLEAEPASAGGYEDLKALSSAAVRCLRCFAKK